MPDIYDWRPTANLLPDNHIRVVFDTRRNVPVSMVTDFANALAISINRFGLEQIQLVHAGRGSTTVEMSVTEQKELAELEKMKAETTLAKTRTLALRCTIVGVLTPLVVAGAAMGNSILEGNSELATLASAISERGQAQICSILVGESCIEIPMDESRDPRSNELSSTPRIQITKGTGNLERGLPGYCYSLYKYQMERRFLQAVKSRGGTFRRENMGGVQYVGRVERDNTGIHIQADGRRDTLVFDISERLMPNGAWVHVSGKRYSLNSFDVRDGPGLLYPLKVEVRRF